MTARRFFTALAIWLLTPTVALAQTIFAGNHDVKNEECRPLPFRLGDDGVAGGKHLHRESLRFQMVPHQAGNIGIVFNHEDAGFHGGYCSGRACGRPSPGGQPTFSIGRHPERL